MALADLFAGDFDRYFKSGEDPASRWLFVHIPKTAGSSITNEVRAALRTYKNINANQPGEADRYNAVRDEKVEGLVANFATAPVRFVSGHITGDHVERICNGVAGIKSFSILRHPVARALSDYRYQRTPLHGRHVEFCEQFKDFQAYIETGYRPNRMVWHLVPSRIARREDWQECFDYILEHYEFIGTQEAYGLSFRSLMQLLGRPKRPTEKRRVTPRDAEDNGVPPDLEKIIRDRNTLDLPVFREVARRLQLIRPSLVAYLDQAERHSISSPQQSA